MSDIVAIIRSTGTSLNRTGNNYIGHCPFHNDKSPSLVVYPKTGSWFCFGNCRTKGGDAIDFIRQKYNYNYKKAKDWIDNNGSFNVKFDVLKEEPKPKIVPHGMVMYWHDMLGCHRNYFHQRGFEDDIIDREMWGWDGNRYTIPVWEGEPQYSSCLGVRKRKEDSNDNLPKYIGLKGSNVSTVWGRSYCQDHKLILAFAGELDAARAVQDNLPAFSIVGGVNSISRFPSNWPTLWFPGSFEMIAIFDSGEESFAGRLCSDWNENKGFMSGKVFHWHPDLEVKDYCEFRQQNSIEHFKEIIFDQMKVLL